MDGRPLLFKDAATTVWNSSAKVRELRDKNLGRDGRGLFQGTVMELTWTDLIKTTEIANKDI
jgi:hypothetical protein